MQSNQELINSIKINGAVPENQEDYSDEVILSLADEVLEQTLLPIIMERKEEYFVFPQPFPITAGKRKYRIPSRSIGAVLRDVQILRGTALSSIGNINPEDLSTTTQGTPSAFYMESNSVCLYPVPSSTDGFLVMKYFIRPARLTPVSNASRVTAFDPLTTTVSLEAIPPNVIVGSILDFTKGTAHYEPLSLDHKVLSINGTDVQLSSLPEDLEERDWISLSGYSPVPSIPEDYHSILALLTASKILQSLGQTDQEQALIAKAEASLARMTSNVSPRVLGEPNKIVSPLW